MSNTDHQAIEMCRRFFNRDTKPGTEVHDIQARAARALLTTSIFAATEMAELVDEWPHGRPDAD